LAEISAIVFTLDFLSLSPDFCCWVDDYRKEARSQADTIAVKNSTMLTSPTFVQRCNHQRYQAKSVNTLNAF